MKVITIASSLVPHSSIFDDVLSTARGLIRLGHDDCVYTTSFQERIRAVEEVSLEGVPVKRFPVTLRYKRFRFSLSLLNHINKIDGDIVHLHECRGFEATIAPLLKKVKRIPLVLSPYGSAPYESSYSYEHKFAKILQDGMTLKSVFRSADIILAETSFEKDELINFGVSNRKIRIIYEKVDPEIFKKGNNGFFDTDSRIVLYVGRINRIKNLQFLIRAFHLARKVHQLDGKLMIVGPCEDSNYLEMLKRLIKDLDLEDHVVFYGLVSHEKLPIVYSSADVLVLPSKYENIGGVLLEAQACECPVIATEVGGMGEVVLNGITGFIVESGDLEGTAQKISFLLQNEHTRQEFGRNARDYVAQNFSLNKYVQRVLDAYNEALRLSD